MSLTEDDVTRLSRSGCHDFVAEDVGAVLRLRTHAGTCVFLIKGRCAVYDDRPGGCVTYPLMYDTAVGTLILDDFCPYREEFRFTLDDRRRLLREIEEEDEQIKRRKTCRRDARQPSVKP